MKLRIKGNSIRIRLSRTEVDNLAKNGYIDEHTDFGNNTLTYALQSKDGINTLEAAFENGKVTMYVPSNVVPSWPTNDTVGFENLMSLPNGKELYLLLEKDFKCIDNSMEDQSDNYENPNSMC
ncbi:MAG: hypothetical protein K0Q79_1997 [Flavipsychrobacter sp.]|jgi:hypothetical protein|nr:hypothetical protein [Flavipsychrobacter sp.]